MASQACFAQTSASEEVLLPLVKIDHSPQPKRNRNKTERWTIKRTLEKDAILREFVGESTQRGLATFIGGSIPPRASNIFGNSYNREKDNAQT